MDDDFLRDMQGLAAHNQRNQANRELAALRQQREQQSRGVCACPHCGGGLPKIGVSVCMHCQRDLVWYKTVVGKPGQKSLCKKTYDDIQERASASKASEAKRRVNEAKKSVKNLKWSVWIAIPYCIYLIFFAVHLSASANPGFFMPLFTVFGMVEGSPVLFRAVAVANAIAFFCTFVFVFECFRYLVFLDDGQQ